MSTATVKLKHGALATVTPDFMITRGITETHSLTLLNADNTALINASVVTWTFQIAQDFLSRTSILAESTSITFADNVLSGILLNAHTVELKAFMQGKAIVPLYGTLIGLNGSAEVVTAITFRIVCTNSVYEPDAEPTPAIVSGYYTKAQVDAKFADIDSTLHIPRDVADLTDDDGLLFDGDYDSLTNKPTIPPDLTGDLAAKEDAANKATDFAVIDDDKFPTVKAVKDFAQNETLTELTGSSVTVAPWTQTKYTADGVCTLTATGWALSGFQWSQIVITVLADATPAIAGTEEVSEDDALSEAGVYHAAFLNLDGKIYFHVSSFTPAEVEE